MNVLLIGINSKYIHTNLALRDIAQYSQGKVSQTVQLVEFTINQRIPVIVDELYRQKADLLLFSCYIWNIEYVKQIIAIYSRIAPQATILVGGPEVSYHPQAFLEECPAVQVVMKGEGEETFLRLMHHYDGTGASLADIPGLVYRTENKVYHAGEAEVFPMAQLPFPYPDLSAVRGKILYFESSRGCPFRCSYCLSSITGGVRLMPLPLAFAYLARFLEAKVPQVKFVDRTFNCNKHHALSIWRFLQEHDNGVTNFHFEVSAHLFDRETLDFLKTVRPEQFQFEVGVQSTNPQTIQQIQRSTDTEQLLSICQEIDSFHNIHQHLDLIAGLPYEGITSFEESFNQVLAIRPQQLQLGFLKILKGAKMEVEAEQHGMVYSPVAPFEVLGTKWLNYDELLLIKGVEAMVELYYNSGRFRNSLAQLLKGQVSPYRFFQQLGVYFHEQGYHLMSLSKELSHSILRDFYQHRIALYSEAMREVVLFDICLKEKPKKFPDWLDYQWNHPHKKQFVEFYLNKTNLEIYLPHYVEEQALKISRLTHLQAFVYDVTQEDLPKRETFILFDYDHPDLLGNARWVEIVF